MGSTKSPAPPALSSLGLAVAGVAVAAGALNWARSSTHVDGALLFGQPASTKPYDTLDSFYAFYLKEHSQPTTRLLHYIGTSIFVAGVVASPQLLLALGLALALGHSVVFPLTRRLATGALEMALVLGVFAVVGKAYTRSWARTLAPAVAAYTFAWVAHFFVEHNRPATFIYPTFSLICDFRMLGDAIRSSVMG